METLLGFMHRLVAFAASHLLVAGTWLRIALVVLPASVAGA